MTVGEDLRSQRPRALGRAIRNRRITLGISRSAAGELVGGAQRDISRIEKGKHATGVGRLLAIRDAVEISLTCLLSVAEEIVEQKRD